MAEEIKSQAVDAAKAEPVAASVIFDRDDYDGQGVDVNNLPKLPWTREALGDETFHQLALTMGAGDLRQIQRASLDPRGFGVGRANRLIELYGLAPDSAQAEAYRQEGLALQEKIDATLPKVSGTPRHPQAKPLTPAVTTIRKGESAPRRL